ncbi:MAG: 30S ribosome-binding factor RbfA [Planctomycetes bacterium]|nr:30S ribosome-binding factor RbfA [Planctomycetota bacterium]
MSTRRQEKIAQVVKQAVSRAIQHDLNDPRIEGIVSVTVVEMAADLRSAEVYLSVLGRTPGAENATYAAIQGARRRIQGVVAKAVKAKFCPVIQLHKDEKFKKTLETMNLIDRAASEYRHDDLPDEEDIDQVSESVDPPTEGGL